MGPMSPGSRVRTPPGAKYFAGGRKSRRRQDSNLRGQSPVDFESTPLTAWVRLRVHGHLAQWQSTGLVNLGSRVRSSQWPSLTKSADRGHAGARTQDLRLIRATLYRLSYTTAGHNTWLSGLVA